MREQKDHSIARELGISYNTLRTQLNRLYRKLGVQTRTGVVVAVFSEVIRIMRESQNEAKSASDTSIGNQAVEGKGI